MLVDPKRHLSRVLADAEAGTPVLVTRHNRPVVRITSAAPACTRVGAHAANPRLEPLLRAPTRGRYLKVLADDRRGGRE